MKKLISVLAVCSILTCSLASCGYGNEKSSESGKSSYAQSNSKKTSSKTDKNDDEKGAVYEKVLIRYINAFNDDDMDAIYKNSYPDAIYDQIMQSDDYDSYSNVWKEKFTYFHGLWNNNCGENTQVSLKEISDEKKIGAEGIAAIEEYYVSDAELTGLYDYTPEIEKAYDINVILEYSGDDDTIENETVMCAVNFKDCGWRIIELSSDMIIKSVNGDDQNEIYQGIESVFSADIKNEEELTAVVEKYLAAMNNSDAELLLHADMPEELVEAGKKTDFFADFSKSWNDTCQGIKEMYDEMYGEGSMITLTSIDYANKFTSAQLEAANVYYEALADEFEADVDYRCTEGFEVGFTYGVNGITDSTNTVLILCVVNIENEGWFIIEEKVSDLEFYYGD